MSFIQYNCNKYPSSPSSKTPSPVIKNTIKNTNVCSTPTGLTSTPVTSLITNGIEALNLSDSSGLCTSSLISTSLTNIENCDTPFTDADIDCLVEALGQNQNERITLNHLMRSASSAGETATRSNQDIHASMPKRAETFNGASSKEMNISMNINGTD